MAAPLAHLGLDPATRTSPPRGGEAASRPGPALGEQDLRISDDLSQTALDVPLVSRPSVRGVPQLHGSMTLVESRRTIYFRAENSNVAEQDRPGEVQQGQNLQVSLRLGQ